MTKTAMTETTMTVTRMGQQCPGQPVPNIVPPLGGREDSHCRENDKAISHHLNKSSS